MAYNSPQFLFTLVIASGYLRILLYTSDRSNLLSLYNLSSFVLNSVTILEITISWGKVFHTGIFLIANEFNLIDLFARGFFNLMLWPLN